MHRRKYKSHGYFFSSKIRKEAGFGQLISTQRAAAGLGAVDIYSSGFMLLLLVEALDAEGGMIWGDMAFPLVTCVCYFVTLVVTLWGTDRITPLNTKTNSSDGIFHSTFSK